MRIPRPLIWAALVLGLTFGLIFLLVDHYRPTLEIDEHESILGLASAILLPFAFSAVIAYMPALRLSARLAGAFCLVVAAGDLLFTLLTASPSPATHEIQFYALLAMVPMLGLFAVSRLPFAKRFPSSLLLVGPTAFWLGLLFSIYIWVDLLGRVD